MPLSSQYPLFVIQGFSKAVVAGKRSGSDKLVYDHYDTLIQIWGITNDEESDALLQEESVNDDLDEGEHIPYGKLTVCKIVIASVKHHNSTVVCKTTSFIFTIYCWCLLNISSNDWYQINENGYDIANWYVTTNSYITY